MNQAYIGPVVEGWDSFDEYKDEHLAAIMRKPYVQVIGNLLHLRNQIRMIERSFGADTLDMKKMLPELKEELERLYQVCQAEFNDL